MTYTLTHLARAAASPQAIDAFARRPDLRGMLRANAHLPADLWWTLWKGKPDQYQACALLSHPIDAGHLEHILGRERRRKVIAAIIDRQEFTARHLEILSSRNLLGSGAVGRIVGHGRYPADAEPLLLGRLPVGHWRQLHAARSRHQFDQDVMLAACADVANGGLAPWWVVDDLVVHPNAGPDVVRAALTVLEGLPDLTGHYDTEQRRTISHLPPITRPWEEADTDDELDLLAGLRDLTRVPTVVASRIRARVDSLTPVPDAQELAAIEAARVDEHEWSPLIPHVTAYLAERLDQAGPGAWDTALTLLTDEYAGTAADLVATAAALADAPAPTVPARVTVHRAPRTTAADRAARRTA